MSISLIVIIRTLVTNDQANIARFTYRRDMASLMCRNRALFAQTNSMITLAARNGSSVPLPLTKVDIGKREVVGYGGNGEATYIDSVMHPFPAIRLVSSAY